MATVRCRRSAMYQHPAGYHVFVREGQAFDAADPLVARFPGAFETDNVEQATAAPGEKRTVRRSRQKPAEDDE